MSQPKRLSVVMPVRDVAPFLDASIKSILDQTYADFDFVILDDGSRDNSPEILQSWSQRDSRIRLFRNAESLGPAGSSNAVIGFAPGNIIARMDGDDVAHPDRLRQQLDTLERNPDACLVGTLWEGLDEHGRCVRPRDRSRLAGSTFSPFPHGSIMFRREVFDRAGGYRAEADFWEDIDLYRRVAEFGKLLVLPSALYGHRASSLSTRLTSQPDKVETQVDRMFRRLLAKGDDHAELAPNRKIMPRVFLSLGSTRVWSGRSPAILSRLIRRGALGWNMETAGILVWAAWGTASPRSLRMFLRFLLRIRDFRARKDFPDHGAYPWNCAVDRQPPRAVAKKSRAA